MDDRIRLFPDIPHGPTPGPLPDETHTMLDAIVAKWREADDLDDQARELEDEARDLHAQAEDREDEADAMIEHAVPFLSGDWASMLRERTDPRT